MPVKEDFDPFEEEYEPRTTRKILVNKSPVTTQQHNRINFDYQKYLIVYTHLSEAIGAMVDALETLKQKKIDVEVLTELIKCADTETKDSIFLQEDNQKKSAEREAQAEASMNTLKQEQEICFQNLLDSHLRKNIHTKEYIVEGRRRKQSRDSNSQPNYQETLDTDSLGSWMFRSHESLTEPAKSTTSAEVQTSKIDGDFKELSDILVRSEIHVLAKDDDSNATSSETSHQDIFYMIEEVEK